MNYTVKNIKKLWILSLAYICILVSPALSADNLDDDGRPFKKARIAESARQNSKEVKKVFTSFGEKPIRHKQIEGILCTLPSKVLESHVFPFLTDKSLFFLARLTNLEPTIVSHYIDVRKEISASVQFIHDYQKYFGNFHPFIESLCVLKNSDEEDRSKDVLEKLVTWFGELKNLNIMQPITLASFDDLEKSLGRLNKLESLTMNWYQEPEHLEEWDGLEGTDPFKFLSLLPLLKEFTISIDNSDGTDVNYIIDSIIKNLNKNAKKLHLIHRNPDEGMFIFPDQERL
jgi:hypothetical protein